MGYGNGLMIVRRNTTGLIVLGFFFRKEFKRLYGFLGAANEFWLLNEALVIADLKEILEIENRNVLKLNCNDLEENGRKRKGKLYYVII